MAGVSPNQRTAASSTTSSQTLGGQVERKRKDEMMRDHWWDGGGGGRAGKMWREKIIRTKPICLCGSLGSPGARVELTPDRNDEKSRIFAEERAPLPSGPGKPRFY